jgi:asparagine N-glycosylation enzyme membrane subunit Stt3
LDSIADQYTFYFAVEVAITLVALFIQIKHFRKSFLNKNQLILVATLAALFQFGSFIVMAIKTVQFHLDISLMQDGVCYFIDCDESATFRWEITGYTIFTWLALLGQIPYFRLISTVAEQS